MSEILDLIDCEDAIDDIAQAQVILELLDSQISKHYGSLGEKGNQALEELGYILSLYRDKEIQGKLKKIKKVMSESRVNSLISSGRIK